MQQTTTAATVQDAIAAPAYDYRVKHNSYGLSIESEVKLEDVAASGSECAGQRIIKLNTSKSAPLGISSFASVCVRRFEGNFRSEVTALGEDYAKRYNATPCKRVTEKALVAAHMAALASFADHIAAAKKHYKIA